MHPVTTSTASTFPPLSPSTHTLFSLPHRLQARFSMGIWKEGACQRNVPSVQSCCLLESFLLFLAETGHSVGSNGRIPRAQDALHMCRAASCRVASISSVGQAVWTYECSDCIVDYNGMNIPPTRCIRTMEKILYMRIPLEFTSRAQLIKHAGER
ncbi:hypothetical protein IE53DRAFT_285878 [Violaceomyces palustris]|uniref:Uncharacterized protein n=1 Tax=Violaceomyces palustris TaxID=1673888 RepID=A0ACD0P2T9_9BASI|nr:hypothetical protein IE53DRAFT_285878 [Violaceomyces palustris]